VANGKFLGTTGPDEVRICKWPSVRLAPGVNKIEAVARTGTAEVRDVCEWTLEPAPAQ